MCKEAFSYVSIILAFCRRMPKSLALIGHAYNNVASLYNISWGIRTTKWYQWCETFENYLEVSEHYLGQWLELYTKDKYKRCDHNVLSLKTSHNKDCCQIQSLASIRTKESDECYYKFGVSTILFLWSKLNVYAQVNR